MNGKKKSDLAVLLSYAGSYRGLTYLGLALSAVAMVLGMLPYICIWLAARDLIAVAPDWTRSAGIERYGWMAFAAETETLLAHNLADIVVTAAMFLSTLGLMLVFDWRVGAVEAIVTIGTSCVLNSLFRALVRIERRYRAACVAFIHVPQYPRCS